MTAGTPAELPNPFQFEDGSHVCTAAHWQRRRQEISELIVEKEYGGLPPASISTRFEVLHAGELKGPPGARILSGRVVTGPEHPFAFLLQLLVPPGDGPFPVVLTGDACWRYATDAVIAAVLGRGCILAQFNRVEIAPDAGISDRTTGIYPVYSKLRFGALAAWAWGYHRCVDVLANMAFVDAAHIAITGHSRGGKAVLLAGARLVAQPPETAATTNSTADIEKTEVNIARVTGALLQGQHFSHHPLDREIANRFMDRYLDALDHSHSCFLQSDLDEFDHYRANLDRLTLQGDTTPGRVIFARFMERFRQRYQYLTNLLATETFEFVGNDRYVPDRHTLPAPKDLAEAKELWLRYVELAHPASVQRVVLRYLNRIALPLPLRDLRDYCPLFPDLPPALPQGMSEFFLRVALPVADAPCVSIVTLTFEPPTPGATVLNLIFDNEVAYGFSALNVDTEAIWSKLAELRDLKNKVFDASLTEKAKELFRQ